MSVKHIPKIYLDFSKKEKHFERLADRHLSRKARKVGFKDCKDMIEYLNFNLALGGASAERAHKVAKAFAEKREPVVSSKELSRVKRIRLIQKLEGVSKKEAYEIYYP